MKAGDTGHHPSTKNTKYKDTEKYKYKDKDEVKRGPNICYIFEKPRAQGFQIWHSDNYDKEKEWHKYKDKDKDKDKYTEKTKTKYRKDHICAVFSKSRWCKDIKYDILSASSPEKERHKYKDKDTDKDKYTEKTKAKYRNDLDS